MALPSATELQARALPVTSSDGLAEYLLFGAFFGARQVMNST
jgi:hypothetical protein